MTATQNPPRPASPAVMFSALGAAVVGAGLSAYLIWVHLAVKGGDTVGGLCNLSAKVNCNVAAGSVYSEVAGLPVAAIGFGFYLATLAVLIVGRFKPTDAGRLLVTLYTAACAYSLFLAAVSAFVLGSFCWACSGLYVVNVVVLILARVLAREGYISSIKRLLTGLNAMARSPLPPAFVVTFVIATAGVHFGSQSLYGATGPTEAEKKTEAEKWAKEVYGVQPRIDDGLWKRMKVGPTKGAKEGCVTLVEFSDFQCPFCSKVVPSVEGILEAYPKDVNVVFRHNPLDHNCNPRVKKKFHPLACGAAYAAVCAGEQGEFWKMHDRLFANQSALAADELRAHATAIGLGSDELAACMGSDAAKKVVATDMSLAVEAGVRGTPALFLNGRKIPGGAVGYQKLAAAVRVEIAQCAQAGN